MDDFSKTDEFLFSIHRQIERSGLMVTSVFGSRTSPSWAYTIGLLEHGHPELVTIGLDPESAHSFLSRAFDETVVDGIPLELGREHDRIWETDEADLHVAFVAVPTMLWAPPSSLVGALHAYYRARGRYPCEPRVAQLVWPDLDGYLPWEPEFDPSMREYQPLLDTERWLPPIPADDSGCCACCSFHDDHVPPNRATRRRRHR